MIFKLQNLVCISAFICPFLTLLYAAPTDGLVAYYPLNGNSNDLSGNANHGTATGTTSTSNRFGEPNTAFFFNGTTDLITLPIQQNNVLKATYSAWFKTSTGGVLLGTSAPSNLPSLVLNVHTVGTGGDGAGSALFVADANSVSVGGNSNPIYNDNQWHHLVGVFDSVAGQLNAGQFSIYIDGVLIAKTPQSVNPPNAPINNSSFMRIGSNLRFVPVNGNFTGSIDEVRIYNRALSPTEIQQIYHFDLGNEPSVILPAVEFRFNAVNGVSYRIEASTNLLDWPIIEPVIIGSGSLVTRFYSTETLPKRFFRARRN